MTPSWYDQAVDSLEEDFAEDFITWEEFHYEMSQLNADYNLTTTPTNKGTT